MIPHSTRPWQHVLEALSGYLDLAVNLKKNKKINGQSFNFSSSKIKNISVIQFFKKIENYWPNIRWKIIKKKKFLWFLYYNWIIQKAKKLIK